MALSAGKKILTLGKEALDKLGDTKLTDKLKKDFLKTGGKKKKVTKVVKKTDTPVKKLASDAKTKRNIKSNIGKAEKEFSKKEYNKKLFDTLKKNQKNKVSKNTTKNKTKQSTDLVPTGQSKTIKETVNPKKIKQNFKTVGSPIDKTPKVKKPKKKSTALVTVPKPKVPKSSLLNRSKEFIKRNKGKIALGAGAALLPFAIGTDKNIGEGKNIGGGNKDKKPKKDFTPKIKKPTTPEVKIKKLPKAPTKTQKKSRSNIVTSSGKPSSTYDAQFTYDQLKKRGLKPKGFMSPENYAKVTKKSSGGLIASLYDKPEKTEKYKGNTTSARQVKGYGKAKKKA